MKAILLAAGLGTRLRPLTDTIPKCLVPIHGKPLLEIWLQLLDQAGCGPFLINLHHLAPVVRTFIRNSRFAERVIESYEPELLGTGGTLLRARDFVGNEPVMLIHADNLSHFDVKAFTRRHNERPNGCEITMMVFETDTPESCGIVDLDESGVVIGFYEKVANPPSRLANGAVYIVEPSVIDFLASFNRDRIDFSLDVIPRYMGRIATYRNEDYHRDIGNPASLQAALREFVF